MSEQHAFEGAGKHCTKCGNLRGLWIHRKKSVSAGWYFMPLLLFVGFAVWQGVGAQLDDVGWRTHEVISSVYLSGMERGEYRLCSQSPVALRIDAPVSLDCSLYGNLLDNSEKTRMFRVTYHGRIDRARAAVVPHWKCRRRDWTLECWAVD